MLIEVHDLGYLTPKDIREISPYETTSVVLLKLTGDDIYAALEAGLRAAGTDNGYLWSILERLMTDGLEL